MGPRYDSDEISVEDVDEARLSVSGAARRLGIAPGTLRTWDRRYGIGPTGHTRGRHRLYSAADMARLELMQHALVQGAPPAEAARYAQSAGADTGGRGPQAGAGTGPLRVRPDPGAGLDVLASLGAGARSPRTAAPATGGGPQQGAPVPAVPDLRGPEATTTVPEQSTERLVRGGGGNLRLTGAGPAARGLGRAALAMNAPTMRALLEQAVATSGLLVTWTDVVEPVLHAVDRRYAASGRGTEVRRLLTECVALIAHAHAHAAVPSRVRRPVLLAGTPDEADGTALVVLAAVLAERQIGCLPLGPALPVDALVTAVRRTAPAVVVLWSQIRSTADVETVAALPVTRPRFRTYVAGPGWDGAALPAGVSRLRTLTDAVEQIGAAVLH
jgi:DNA-binding transcriptional MerR regulator